MSKMRVDVTVVPQELEQRDLGDLCVVVLDVLRASSTIVTAMANGCEEIIPTATVEEAVEIAHSYGKGEFLLGGERKGNKIEGFDLGNSPSEYTPERVKGKKVIFTTTNGTRLLKATKGASTVVIGSFLNLEAATEYALNLGKDVILACAGDGRRLALEDLACAGMMADYLVSRGDLSQSDGALAARLVYQAFRDDVGRALGTSEHGKFLINAGYAGDLELCSMLNVHTVVPCFSQGHIVRI
ncbi:MAG TPA: 2-phosphosulfolactate phosphatase [Firmicutes bacterium]|nr:2-phosphosulfolactate phosphatase [Bacillota bacterium]